MIFLGIRKGEQSMDNALKSNKSSRESIALIVCALWFIYQLYLALISPLHPMIQAPIHLIFGLTTAFLFHPANNKHPEKKWPLIFDAIIFVGIGFLVWYIISQATRLQERIPYISPITQLDVVAMVIIMIILMESVRRTLGWALFIFISIFIFYMWFGKYFPGIIRFRGTNLKKFTELMIMSSDGIYGTPLYTSSSVIYYFVMFGAFFSLCGGGQVLIDIGMKASNKSSGGPAKAAVISSGLLGMISGSAVANVSTTGVMTIPMMKKVGYQPHEAGAVEAVASTGGQIMPPIMGIGAFIMAEMLGVSYIHIATSAIIPAIAYYLSIFFLVTFIAKKRDLDKKSALVAFDTKPIIPRLYLLLPAIILVYYMVIGASLMRSAMIGIFSIILINFIGLLLPGRQNYIPLRKLLSAIRDGGKQAAEIAIPTAACGIIIGIVIQSGLATKISSLIASVGISNKLIALMIGMTGCLILGMALPTVAAYLVSVVLFVPSLTGLGISPLQANMFIFYFGVLAQITPPVCLASYTAAGIAGANAMKTGWTAFKYALVAFLIPFVFVYDPSILLIGTPYQIIKGIIMTVISVYLLASGLAGYMNGKINSLLQAILIVASVLVIVPEIISSIIGIIIGIIVFIITFAKRRNIEAVSEGRVSNV